MNKQSQASVIWFWAPCSTSSCLSTIGRKFLSSFATMLRFSRMELVEGIGHRGLLKEGAGKETSTISIRASFGDRWCPLSIRVSFGRPTTYTIFIRIFSPIGQHGYPREWEARKPMDWHLLLSRPELKVGWLEHQHHYLLELEDQ